jgi:NADPH:quinone reductase-like Zn-dependent oxidoreductase
MVTKLGGPEVLRVVDNELRPPQADEVRIKVLAASVSRPDVTVRSGKALYSGTPLGQKVPFVPGYSIIGDVNALGEDVISTQVGARVASLTIVGGYSEYVYVKADRIIPVPADLDPLQAVPLVLNYIVAYHALHRAAQVKAGDKVLVIGASGGIGTAVLQLGRLAGLKMIGLASPAKHADLKALGAVPLDYRAPDLAARIRELEPDGLDAVIDGMMTPQYVKMGVSLLKRGGCMVSYGEPSGFSNLFRVLFRMLAVNLLPNGKKVKLYGTSSYFLFDKQPYLRDWALLFELLQKGEIAPLIAEKFPLLEAARANALLESGKVVGNLVLAAPELI